MIFRYLSIAVSLLALASCGRSEDVGWSGREQSDSAGADAAQPAGLGVEDPELEYQRLGAILEPVSQEAMLDETLMADWQQLLADVETAIIQNSSFHQGLMQRKQEIEARFQEVEETGEEMSEEERATLTRHYTNIQLEMGRQREEDLKGAFIDRYMEFKARLFDKMRELEPNLVAEINRFEELDWQLEGPGSGQVEGQ
jgi:hypothetical protein